MYSEEVVAILSVGVWLKDTVGVLEWALTRQQTLTALEAFRTLGIPILGGDVYKIVEGKPKPIGESWYSEQRTHESEVQFAMRSVNESIDYVTRYPMQNSESHLFVLVPRNRP